MVLLPLARPIQVALTWLLIATCTAEHAARNPSIIVPPSRDPFFTPPTDLAELESGSIMRHRRSPTPSLVFNHTAVEENHQVLYRTTDSLGAATGTVLTIMVPFGADRSKMLSYQAVTDAVCADCMPSYALQLPGSIAPNLGPAITPLEVPLMEYFLQQRWIVISPDYQRLHGAWQANRLAGHAILDGIRAAMSWARLTHGSEKLRIAMWRASAGGQVTTWVSELRPQYAPELDIAGAAIGGVVPSLYNVLQATNNGPASALIPSTLLGLAVQYPSMNRTIAAHLKPECSAKFFSPLARCLTATLVIFGTTDVWSMFDDWRQLMADGVGEILHENDLGKAVPRIPLIFYKTTADEVSPIEDTDALLLKYCKGGASVQYVREAGPDHTHYNKLAASRAISWLRDALNGVVQESQCDMLGDLISQPALVSPPLLK